MKIKITLLEEVLGSSPSNEELLATYIASKAPTNDLTAEEVDNIKAQNAEDRITVFPKLADGNPFIWDYQIKGLLKDSCKALAAAGKAGYPGGKACAALKAYKKAIDGLILSIHEPSPTTCTGCGWATVSARCVPVHLWVSVSASPNPRAYQRAAPPSSRLNVLTRSWKIWCVNASTTAPNAG